MWDNEKSGGPVTNDPLESRTSRRWSRRPSKPRTKRSSPGAPPTTSGRTNSGRNFEIASGTCETVISAKSSASSPEKTRSESSVRVGCTLSSGKTSSRTRTTEPQSLLRRLLHENGIESVDWPVDRTKRALEQSHCVRCEAPPVRFDTLFERDSFFWVWRRYFEDVLTVRRGED